MPYTHTPLSALKTILAARLGDTGKVYWVDDELGEYLIEALRTWGLITGYWKDTGSLVTSSGTSLYDISSITNTGGEALLSRTVTDTSLCETIQYHLLEPSTGTTWTGSDQFTLADMTGALQRRRDMLLADTGAVLTRSTPVLPAATATLDLSEDIMLVRRMAWQGAVTAVKWPLYLEDISGQRNYSTGYLLEQGTPQTYSLVSEKPSRYLFAPQPNEPGTLDLLTINAGTTITAQGVVLGVPDDMAWIIKWGAMADMLGREGPGQDLARSYYCERQWRMGVELAKTSATIINAEISGVSLGAEAIHNLDNYMPNWQTSLGTPTLIASFRNYIGLATCPDGVYSVLLDVVRKAVVPDDDADNIQISEEYLDAIVDYAEHLAAFKCGGQEFRHTYRAADNFYNTALAYNQRLAAQSPALVSLLRQTTQDDYVQPPRKRSLDPVLESQIGISDQGAQIRRGRKS